MNCTICGKPIILVPSAEERAKKDLTGKSATYYRSLFTEHSDCTLRKRAEDTSKLMLPKESQEAILAGCSLYIMSTLQTS